LSAMRRRLESVDSGPLALPPRPRPSLRSVRGRGVLRP
jgi:hypothetical protein